jgi:hypothetical protein
LLQVIGVREAVQLRECDFGNLQDAKKMSKDLKDRDMFGRFWFRFPNGESGADVYDRITQFEDHLTRDMLMVSELMSGFMHTGDCGGIHTCHMVESISYYCQADTEPNLLQWLVY